MVLKSIKDTFFNLTMKKKEREKSYSVSVNTKLKKKREDDLFFLKVSHQWRKACSVAY